MGIVRRAFGALCLAVAMAAAFGPVDVASYNGGTRTVDLGDGNNSNNAQLDLAADRVLAVLFSVKIQ